MGTRHAVGRYTGDVAAVHRLFDRVDTGGDGYCDFEEIHAVLDLGNVKPLREQLANLFYSNTLRVIDLCKVC